MQQQVFISSIFHKAWSIFKKQWLTIWGIILVPMLVGMLFSMIVEPLPEVLGFVVTFAYVVLQLVLGIVVIRAFLHVIRGEQIVLEKLFQVKDVVVKFLLANILYIGVVLIGLLLLVVPGIYLAIKYMFMPYLVVDEGLSPQEAMKRSAQMTAAIKLDILGFVIVAGLVTYSGFLLLLVGGLVSLPVGALAMPLLYEFLRKRA